MNLLVFVMQQARFIDIKQYYFSDLGETQKLDCDHLLAPCFSFGTFEFPRGF